MAWHVGRSTCHESMALGYTGGRKMTRPAVPVEHHLLVKSDWFSQ
jgi:hypothetical protein